MAAGAPSITLLPQAGLRFASSVARRVTPPAAAGTSPAADLRRRATDPVAPPSVFLH